MARTLILGDVAFTPPQRRLLGGWRDILDDVRELSRSLGTMPDGCRCGNATGHLSGSCSCCQPADGTVATVCADCSALLATCEARIDTLVTDTLRFFPSFTHILVNSHPPETQNGAAEVQHEIGGLVRTFQRTAVAAAAFRAGCRASHLPALKQAAADLHAHAERLERLL